MPSFDESLAAIEAALAARYGLPTSRPLADADPFSALVSVLLGQTLDEHKIESAVEALRDTGLLEADALNDADPSELEEALKIARISVPARVLGSLKRLARWLVDQHAGSADALRESSISTSALREELIGVNGIGPARADALLLFALQRPAYPIDRATYRVLARHGWIDPSADYDEAQSVVRQGHPDAPDALARLSLWMDRVGREYCKPSAPRCDGCPLRPFLPEDGPREAEGT